MSLSAPSAINLDFYQVKFDAEDLNKASEGLAQRRDTIVIEKKGSKDSMFVQSVDLTSQPDPCRSLSVLTDSTEQSAPVNFDMSNRVSVNWNYLWAFFKLGNISGEITKGHRKHSTPLEAH
jgi:hypothetical protein